MEDEEALSLLASDRSVKPVSVESLHSSSDDEEGEGSHYEANLAVKGTLQADQPGDAAENAVGADSKDGTQLSVAAVRELWRKWSSTCHCCTVAML